MPERKVKQKGAAKIIAQYHDREFWRLFLFLCGFLFFSLQRSKRMAKNNVSRKTEVKINRKTDRQTDRQRDRQTDRKRQIERQNERDQYCNTPKAQMDGKKTDRPEKSLRKY